MAFTAVGVVPGTHQAGAQTDKAITINNFQYSPADLAVKVGDKVTVTNNDDAPHTVTARDGSFNAEVPAHGNATLTVPKAGSHDYYCTYHPTQHNPAKITAS
jgi:plastocyanin